MITLNFLSAFAFSIVAILIDWAIFTRISNLIPNAFPDVKIERYIHYTKLRILFLVFGSFVFLSGISSNYRDYRLALFGGIFFILSHIYVYFVIYLKNKE